MLTNYLKIALRNLSKNRLYTLLNISGLAIGVAACLLILLYVGHELMYDRWNPQADRIVRPTYDIRINDFNERHGSVDALVGPEAAAALPEIEAWCRLRNEGTWDTRRDGQAEQNAREERVLFADSSFFQVFPLKVLAGDPAHNLDRPGTAAISRSRAEYYFGSPVAALGQTLIMGRSQDRKLVTVVFEDIPVASHFHGDVLMPMMEHPDLANTKPYWGYTNNYFTYFLLQKGVDKKTFERKFLSMANDKVSILIKDLFATTAADFEKAGQHALFNLQNLPDIHLYSHLQSELDANGNARYVWIFGAIAFFILLIACINFMNLSTARSAGRAREVGVRKVLGSSRTALAGQFLTESVALSTLAVALAVGLAQLALPEFRELSGRDLAMPWTNPYFGLSLLGGALLVGLLAGSYPAFFLSAFQSIRVLKGAVSNPSGNKGVSLRNGLVVFQFTVSTALILCTLLVYSQLRFIQKKELGFDKSQVIILDNARALGNNLPAFKEELLKNAQVESAAITSYLPLPDSYRENAILSPRRGSSSDDKVMQRWRVDADYVRTLGMQITQGRGFDPARMTDSTAIVINETAARELGLADPLGQKLYTSRTKAVDSKPEDYDELTVIGVVKDFHFRSLHDNIGSLFLQLGRENGALSIRMKGADAAPVIAALETQWARFSPDQEPRFRFMDETLNRMYGAEQRIGKIALLFALLAAFVSCLGLFGLAAFTTEQRTKEIGIRKVLGASVSGITRLLAGDFLKLVGIAIALASPVAFYFMQRWLTDFAYRIDIQWWMFAAAGLVALGVAALTVSFQSIRAALANPVESLRNE
ncbi:MAG TPA: ABC transporter permease [Saprospiraceae bacterium]|nr:ABC transporter permease [Saprospiraceae bacterium]